MKEFIEYIAKQLVDHPESVIVDERIDEDKKLLLTIRVSQSDTGKVIGDFNNAVFSIKQL